MTTLTEPAKCLLLIALLTKDHIISNNGKAFLKELILRRDPRLAPLMTQFEQKQAVGDVSFLEQIHELISAEAQSHYDDLFADTSLEVGKMLSKSERESKNLNEEKSLIYGEVEFASFYRVLRKINPGPGQVFYDLGSGTGKALFAARLTQDFSKCLGVEILQGLHTQAVKIVDRYNASTKQVLALGQAQYAQVFEGSFLDYDWADGDVVFANSTCFSDELMQALSDQAERLKPGAMVVTFTKGMSSRAFELLERKRYRMSWGPATVFIHRRLGFDGKPVGPARLNVLPSDAVTYDDDGSSSGYHAGAAGQPTAFDYDDDIDYDLKQYDDEDEDDEEDDEEDYEEGEDEDDEEEGSEDDEEEADEGDDENSGTSAGDAAPVSPHPGLTPHNSAIGAFASPQRAPASASPRSAQVKASPGGSKASPYSSSQFVSESKEWRSPSAKDSKSSPASSKASSISVPTGDLPSADVFAMLNSPLDEALLSRKRSGRKLQPSDSSDDLRGAN